MKKLLLLLVSAGFAASAGAADPVAGGERFMSTRTPAGSCLDCHDEDYFSDPQRRKADSYHQLRGWVQGCNLHFDVGWFPEDEDDVTAYLNERFYHFATP